METQLATTRLNSAKDADKGVASRVFGGVAAAALMTIAANCFLKYLWWAACYSAWSGIPKLEAQWQRAGTRASLFGWSVVVLELASFLVIFGLLRRRSVGLLKNAFRIVLSVIITAAGTGSLALAITWMKQVAQ